MNSIEQASERRPINHALEISHFREYLHIILRGKWVVLLSFSATLLATAMYTFTVERIYQATATVLIDTRGPQASVGAFGITGGGASYYYINNELEILKSRSQSETVARRLLAHLYIDEDTREIIPIVASSEGDPQATTVAHVQEIAGRVSGSVEFIPVRQSDMIRIVAQSTHPKEAALIANTFARVYYDGNIRASRARSAAAREFLEAQLSVKKSTLTKAEQLLQSYMERTGIVSLGDESKTVIDQLARFEAKRDEVDVDLESARKTLTSYQEQLAIQEPNVAEVIAAANDPYIRLLQEKLARLEVQRDVTIAQNPEYVGQEIYDRKLKQIDQEIAALRKNLESRSKEFLKLLLPGEPASSQSSDPAGYLKQIKRRIIELQVEVQAFEARKKALGQVISQYERQFEQIPEKSIQYARVQRAKLSSENLYLLVEQKYNEAVIVEQSEFGYINIIDFAVVPSGPVSPNTTRNILFGVIVGSMLGVGLVLIREHLNVRIRMPEDLKNRGLVMLSAVPVMTDEIRSLREEGGTSTNGKELDEHLLSITNPRGQIAESYRWLRTNVQYSQFDSLIRTVVITSANPQEGKTVTASNFAVTFAEIGKKVLLVDADLRRPELHVRFDVDKEPGLCQVLFGEASLNEAVHESVVENLDVLTCGLVPPNPSEILGSEKMRKLLKKAKLMYDLIIIDSSPVLAVTDPSNLSTLVDGVVLVVLADKTRADALEGSFEALVGVGAKILGVVLNKFDLRKAYGGYYGYYHYRYSYYGHGEYGSNAQSMGRKKEEKIQGRV